MVAAQFALFAREQDIALGARFAVEMLPHRAYRPQVVNLDGRHFDLSRWAPLMMTAFAVTLLIGNLGWTWSRPKTHQGYRASVIESM
jgi:hypothetical protein